MRFLAEATDTGNVIFIKPEGSSNLDTFVNQMNALAIDGDMDIRFRITKDKEVVSNSWSLGTSYYAKEFTRMEREYKFKLVTKQMSKGEWKSIWDKAKDPKPNF